MRRDGLLVAGSDERDDESLPDLLGHDVLPNVPVSLLPVPVVPMYDTFAPRHLPLLQAWFGED